MNPPKGEARSTAKPSAPENKLTQQANQTTAQKSTTRKKPVSKQLALVRTMPPLTHWPDRTKTFDPRESKVCEWLTKQPDFLNWLFRQVKERSLIEFDQQTRTWRGADYLAATAEKVASHTPPAVNEQAEIIGLLKEIADAVDESNAHLGSINGELAYIRVLMP
jgi:hypothetical protein